jgi:hypothetical protein
MTKKYPTMWVKCKPRREGQPGKTICRKPWARNRQFTETPEEVELTPLVHSSLLRMIKQGSLVQCSPPAPKGFAPGKGDAHQPGRQAQPMTAQPAPTDVEVELTDQPEPETED